MFDITKISFNRGLTLCLIILSLIAPPTLALYFFERKLFYQLEFFKLLLLILSFGTVPLCNSFILGSAYLPKVTTYKKKRKNRKRDLRASTLTNVLGLNVCSIFLGSLIYSMLEDISRPDVPIYIKILSAYSIAFTIAFVLLYFLNKSALNTIKYTENKKNIEKSDVEPITTPS